jgi:hypothetical protein
MTNLTDRFNNATITPNPDRHRHHQQDPFYNLGSQDLSALITAATTALRYLGYQTPLPSPPTIPPGLQTQRNDLTQHQNPPWQSQSIQRPPVQPPPWFPPPPPYPPSARQPDMWDNAKVKQIICAGIKPAYNGFPDQIIPTLNLINIHRRNEVWYSATFLMQENVKIDLVMQFSQVKEATVLANAAALWDRPDATMQSHTRGTSTYNNCLLGVFLMNSLTPTFAALLHSRIDPAFCSDGPLLLYTMCQHIHRNHLAFVELSNQRFELLH